jgi:hypothetical protein
MWSFSQLLSRINTYRRGSGRTSPVDLSPGSEDSYAGPTSGYSPVPEVSPGLWDTGREPPVRLEEELTIQAMYKSWVELESSVTRAHDDLRTILANRERASSLRREAEQVLLEGEAIREEARRIGESAWQAFDRGFAINPRRLASQSARLREVEEAIKTQGALQHASHRDAWDESDKTRQKATADLLKVLMVLRTALVQVERELHEAANLPAVAESLKESAREELRGAEAIRNELAFLGQEALHLLGAEPSIGESPKEDLSVSEPGRSSLETEEGQVAFAPGLAETPRLEGRTPAYPAQEPRELLLESEEGVEATTSVAWEPVEAQPHPAGIVDPGIVDIETAPQPQPAVEREEPEEIVLPEVPQQTVQQPAAPLVIEIPASSPAASVAEELRREMDAISLSGPMAQGVPPAIIDSSGEVIDVSVAPAKPEESSPGGVAQELMREMEALRVPAEPPEERASSAAQDLTNELAALTRLGASAATASGEDLPPQAPPVTSDQPRPAVPVATPPPVFAVSLPESYTGRLFLMFPATLSQDSLESVWDFLEEVAGPGSISDMRLVSQDAGVQFTMELWSKMLGMDELRRRIPDAELVPLAADRLRINWTG